MFENTRLKKVSIPTNLSTIATSLLTFEQSVFSKSQNFLQFNRSVTFNCKKMFSKNKFTAAAIDVMF